jgi:putative aldouronate transport system substrate-binding protein
MKKGLISQLVMVCLVYSFLFFFFFCNLDNENKLVFMTIGSGEQQDSQMVWSEFNRRIKDYIPGIDVEFIVVPAHEFAEQFELRMFSGLQVDIAWTGYAFSFAEQVEKGNYMNLDSLVESYAHDLKTNTLPWMLDLGSINGNLYQIPRFEWMNEWRMALTTQTNMFEAHWDVDVAQDIFINNNESYRSMTPGMYDYLESYLSGLKNAYMLQSGVSFRGMNFNYGAFMYDSASAPIMRVPRKGANYDFTVYNYYELPEVKLYYQKVAEFYQKGYLPSNIMDINLRDYENSRLDNSFMAWFDEYLDFNNTPYYSGIVANNEKPLTKISLEDEYYITRIESVSGHVIPRTAKNPQAAIKLIELLNTSKGKELYNLLTFGIEGVHYNKVGENRIETIDYVGYPDANSRYGLPKWSVGNVVENCYLTQTEITDNYFDFMRNLPNEAIISPMIGFKPDVKDIRLLNMAVQAVVNEYEWELGIGILGNNWEARYNLMIQKMKEAGIDQILNELQRQVDAYLFANGISKTNTKA